MTQTATIRKRNNHEVAFASFRVDAALLDAAEWTAQKEGIARSVVMRRWMRTGATAEGLILRR